MSHPSMVTVQEHSQLQDLENDHLLGSRLGSSEPRCRCGRTMGDGILRHQRHLMEVALLLGKSIAYRTVAHREVDDA